MDNPRDGLVAFLHDPPDKALQIPGHEARAQAYLRVALGDTVSEAELKDPADPAAAIAERLPAPHWQTLTVSVQNGQLTTRHPLSGVVKDLVVGNWNQAAVAGVIERLVARTSDTEQRLLLLWRRLQEDLARDCGVWFQHLPADTRIPDHTIWQHLDTTAGLKAAHAGSGADAALLSFSLGPVQSFIAAARSVRDLWSGSMLLAWLTFQGMLPIIERLGPTALVYPALRGLPWLDIWLRDAKHLAAAILPPPAERCVAPCIPNRFLALVPWGQDGRDATEFATLCRQAADRAWHDIAESVHSRLQRDWQSLPTNTNWDARWREQIDHFFEIRTAVLPWRIAGSDETIGRLLAGEGGFTAAFPDAVAVRSLADAIPDRERPGYPQLPHGYSQQSAGSWQAKVELSARLMQAQRAIRHVPPATEVKAADEDVPPKCSLLGSLEQMGPAGLDDSRAFWQQAAATTNLDGVRLRDGERFSAVALVKRFCGPCFFRRKLPLELADLRYEDTATVAAAEWLAKEEHAELKAYAEDQRSSQWLHWSSPTQGREDGEPAVPKVVWNALQAARRREPPPAYYAVLMLDGDALGRWLRGDQSPPVHAILHPQLRAYYEHLPGTASGLKARRPVGPALHAAISEALANFALHFVPRIVERHSSGRLIYAGGDDVLAVLPTRTALACARDLRDTFRENWKKDEGTNREYLLMGDKATVSAGLAVVHYKADLRFALQAARTAERAAKQAGRDALQIAVCRRSGEHTSALCPWDFAPEVEHWVEAFWPRASDRQRASDRWTYHLRAELPTLCALQLGAMQAEIRRQIGRAEEATRCRFGGGDKDAAASCLVAAFDKYRLATRPDDGDGQPGGRRFTTDGEALAQFITLCQSASFLARGRDE